MEINEDAVNDISDVNPVDLLVCSLEEYILMNSTNEPKGLIYLISDKFKTVALCLKSQIPISFHGRGLVLKDLICEIIKHIYADLALPRGSLIDIISIGLGCDGAAITESFLLLEVAFFRKFEGIKKRFASITKNRKVISGIDSFLLYKDFGVSFDLIADMAANLGVSVDNEAFDYEKSKSNSTKELLLSKMCDFKSPEKMCETDDSYKYEHNNINSKIISIVHFSGFVAVACERTCFYADKGGQIGDHGKIIFICDEKDVGLISVIDVREISGCIWHFGCLEGVTSESVVLSYNEEFRSNIRGNHTAAHLLDHFVRVVLNCDFGKYESSLVEDLRVKYVYSSKRPMSLEEIEQLEKLMNDCISKKIEVQTIVSKFVDLEKDVVYDVNTTYPEVVRCIRIADSTFSVADLCCGTHVDNTSELRLFKIITENTQNSTKRRIVGYTGNRAIQCVEESKKPIPVGDIPLLERKMIESRKAKEREVYMAERSKILKDCEIRFDDELCNFEAKNFAGKAIFGFQIDSLKLDSKDVKNLITKFIKAVAAKNYNGIVYSVFESVFRYGYVCGDDRISDSLKSVGIDSKKIRNISQGSCLISEETLSSIENCFGVIKLK